MHDFCIGKDLAATGKIIDDEGYISYIVVHGAGTITVKNGIDATGEIYFKATITGTDSKYFPFPYPIKMRNGIYVELSGVTATIGYFG